MSTIDEQKQKASKTLLTMLDYLGLDATLKTEEKGQKIALLVCSEDAGRIIGRKGQTLENLQLLLNRIMFKGDQEFPKVVIDIDGYTRKERERRPRSSEEGGRHEDSRRGGSPEFNQENEDRLVKQAQDAASEVKRWGDPVTLPPMNAHDRRIIHITLQDDPELVTESLGDGAKKNVVISLKK